jgi:hypothetical protein
MYTCDDCRENIWDDLFGLLDGSEREALRLHLAACEACQAERTTALTQHRLVAEAARLDSRIPPFIPPLLENSDPVSGPTLAPAIAPRRRVRALPWLAAAAAILLLVGLPFGVYQYGRARHEAAWRTAERDLAQIVQEREEFRKRAQIRQADLVQETLAKHPRLRAVGPAAYQVGAANSYQVWATDVEGRPVDTPVTARLLSAGTPLVLETKRTAGKGEWLVDLPANLPLRPESTPRLELSTWDQAEPAPVGTYLRVLEPAYRTHLAMDKPVYHTGDTVYFRSLTLERFGLRIPDRQFTASYTLSDARGKELQTVRGLTWKGGVGGGAFPLSSNWPAGEYRLTVTEAENRFPAVTHRLWIHPAAPRADRQGDTSATKTATQDRVEVEFFPEGGDLLAGIETRVYFRVRTLGGNSAALQGAIVDSHDREVVRLQTVQLKGQRDLGLGVFMLQPRLGETYRLRVDSPRGVDVRGTLPDVREQGVVLSLAAAVIEPAESVHAVLQCTGPAQSLVAALFCQGRLVAQQLVPAASGRTEVRLTPTMPCSGVFRLTVFEERKGRLWPIAERLAYRRPEGRLALSLKADKEHYAAGEHVRLAVSSRNEKGAPEAAWLFVSVVDQTAGRAASAEASLPAYFYLTSELQRPEDIEQADILLSDSPEAATALDLFLGSQGWRRFVDQEGDRVGRISNPSGILGRIGNPSYGAVHYADAGAMHRAEDMATPAIVKLDNGEEVGRRYATSLSQASFDLQDAVAQRDRELAGEGVERLQAARVAAQDLDAYEERAAGLVQLSLGVGGVVLLIAGCLFLTIGLVRVLRGVLSRPEESLPRPSSQRAAKAWHPVSSTAYLSGAFAALSLCALVLWRPFAEERPRQATDLARLAGYAAMLDKRFDLAIALPREQAMVSSQAVSKRSGPLPRDMLGNQNAAPSNELAEAATQKQNAGSGSPNPRPRIGFIGIGRGDKGPSIATNQSVPRPLPIRSYAYSRPKEPAPAGNEFPDTVLWQPIVFAENGAAEVGFTLPTKAATYQIQAEAHSAAGRVGAVNKKLECRQSTTP